MTGAPTPVPQPRAPVRLASGDVTEEYLRMAASGQGSIICEPGYDMQLHQAEVEFSKGLHIMFGGIILDYREKQIDLALLDEIIRKRLWWCENHPSIDIVIVLGDRDVQVWRYPQKK